MPDLVYYTIYLRPAHVLEYLNVVTLVPYDKNNTSQTNAEELFMKISLFQFVGQNVAILYVLKNFNNAMTQQTVAT